MRTSPPTPLGRRDGDSLDPPRPRGAFSRRALLKGAAATAAMTANGSGRAAAAPPVQPDDHVDVAVVGAGLAGLTAARALAKACRSVVVLEANHHVGGRMIRREVGPGAYVDLGGQWVGPTAGEWAQSKIIALADELGLERFAWYHAGARRFVYRDISATFDGTFLPFEGEPPPVAADEVRDAEGAWKGIEDLAATVPPEAPWTAPDAGQLDQETLASWLDRTTRTEFARFAITNMARIGGSGAFEPEQVSLLHMAFTQAASPQRAACPGARSRRRRRQRTPPPQRAQPRPATRPAASASRPPHGTDPVPPQPSPRGGIRRPPPRYGEDSPCARAARCRTRRVRAATPRRRLRSPGGRHGP